MTVLLEVSGLLKILESVSVFVCLGLHRIGNRGSQIWFGTADFEMNYKSSPSEVDAEIIGCGILTCMAIVSPLILLSYVTEGRQRIQGTVLDCGFCVAAAALLMCAGGMSCFTYNSVFALSGPRTVMNLNIDRLSMQAAGSLGVMCIVTSLFYIADFFYLLVQRNIIIENDY